MHLPKMSLRKGILASLMCVVLAFIVCPLVYDHFGSGAELTRTTVAQSPEVRGKCTEVKTFVVVPWSVSLDDRDDAGHLSIGYWFGCGGKIGTVRSKMHHLGGAWVMDSVVVDLKSDRYELVQSRKASSP